LLREFERATEEGDFLARELSRVVASSGEMIGYGDCAVLRKLQFNVHVVVFSRLTFGFLCCRLQ
jgi:hypothetical protein